MKNRKSIIILFFISFYCFAQEKISSQVITWDSMPITERPLANYRKVLESTTPSLSLFKVHATTQFPKNMPRDLYNQANEEMIIVKEGTLHVMINNESKNLGPGSVALIMPDDMRSLRNYSDKNVVYYVFQFFAKEDVNVKRGKENGGSMMVSWDELQYKVNEKGGRRDFFNRPTAMLQRLEVHATTLNPGIMSHPAHTHEPAEIILPIKFEEGEGLVEEYFYEKANKAKDGDVIFLQSMDLHGIKNIGKKKVTYFAFQFN